MPGMLKKFSGAAGPSGTSGNGILASWVSLVILKETQQIFMFLCMRIDFVLHQELHRCVLS